MIPPIYMQVITNSEKHKHARLKQGGDTHNKGKVVLHIHVSNSAERAAKKEQRTTSTALHERSDESHTTLLPPFLIVIP